MPSAGSTAFRRLFDEVGCVDAVGIEERVAEQDLLAREVLEPDEVLSQVGSGRVGHYAAPFTSSTARRSSISASDGNASSPRSSRPRAAPGIVQPSGPVRSSSACASSRAARARTGSETGAGSAGVSLEESDDEAPGGGAGPRAADDAEAPEPKPYDREEQTKRLRAAERSMAMLGKVNPLALEEFAALEERHTFLTTQLEDLRRSKQDLLDIVSEIDERVEQVFAEAFADTAEQFRGVFSRLFPGGEGKLVLTDPERRMIAGVYSNRLKAGMPLQADPTVIYPITKGRPLGRRIRQSELDADNGYNTYAMAGLPDGPIANPGRESIAAVLNPQPTEALYFVADGTGGHVFANTLEEHNANVATWYAIRRARGEM